MEKKFSIMRPMLGIAGIVLLIAGFFLVVAIGIGYLLHWLLPSIEVGAGMVAGLIALCVAMFIYWKFSTFMMEVSAMDEVIEQQIAEEEEKAVASAKPVIHNMIREFHSPRRNKRKRD